MKTRVPPGNPPAVQRREDGRNRQVRHYRLITPLYGGGVEPGRPDPITVVRGTEVRGHLRFWWRATRGGQFDSSLEKMRGREGEIWGSAAASNKPGPSQVIIGVEAVKDGRPFEVHSSGRKIRNIGDFASPYSYAAFPLRSDESDPPVLIDVEFRLHICFPPDVTQDVEASLWAWETFGGLGARTRRGFGALEMVSVDGDPNQPPARDQAQASISAGLERHVVPGECPEGVPHLTQLAPFVVVPGTRGTSAVDAWRHLIDELKRFRQDRHLDSRQRPYGRTKWPEADEVRRLTKAHSPHHKPQHPVRKFPRGQFGLPIIFHFKDAKRGDPADDPQLQGCESDRFASPLILRPLACRDGAVGLAVKLESPEEPPGGFVLQSGDMRHSVQVHGLSESEADQIEPLDGEPDVLQAFLRSLEPEEDNR